MSQNNSVVFYDRAHEIFSNYLNSLQRLIIEAEAVSGEFPVQVLNEIRAAFTHLARADKYKEINPALSEDNCNKATRHIKRGCLDCYKILCIAYDDEIREFDFRTKEINLHLADNGEFFRCYKKRCNDVRACYVVARKYESGDSESDEDVFDKYEAAYHSYLSLHEYMNGEEFNDCVLFCSQMTDKNKELVKENNELTKQVAKEVSHSRRNFWISVGLTIFSIVLAITSIAEGIIIYFLSNPV